MLATLRRGYAVVQDADGHVVTSVSPIKAKQKLSIRVVDGRIAATATGTERLTDAKNTREGDSDE